MLVSFLLPGSTARRPVARPTVIALASALLVAAASCNDDPASTSTSSSAGGSGGSSTSANSGSSGGSGGDASDAGGNTGGSVDTGAAGSGGTVSTSASTTGSAGAGGTPPEPVSFCDRLSGEQALAGEIALEFDLVVQSDCRVSGFSLLYVTTEGNMRADFLNELVRFNMRLWGCTGSSPDEFGLIYLAGLGESAEPLSSADVDTLIDDYLEVATPRLMLSQSEIAGLEAQLAWLAAELVGVESMDAESAEYTRSKCGSGAAGAGGAGGEAGGPSEIAGRGRL